jgi:hypothetical protein
MLSYSRSVKAMLFDCRSNGTHQPDEQSAPSKIAHRK